MKAIRVLQKTIRTRETTDLELINLKLEIAILYQMQLMHEDAIGVAEEIVELVGGEAFEIGFPFVAAVVRPRLNQ